MVEEWRKVPYRDCSVEDLVKRHETHTTILKKREEWHKSKFDSWMRWHEATLAERDKSIEQQQVVLENLSTLIKQKNKTLHKQRLKLDLQMRVIDELNNKINYLINKKEEPRLTDFVFAGEVF
ncbi:putative coiled-coil protein SlyX [Bartonella japonica]|uniref:Coiled-coil protein SlyX n=1 Tax=Bartonella japonica TaxID=357761 RepID=A0ABV2FQI7_9HYPH